MSGLWTTRPGDDGGDHPSISLVPRMKSEGNDKALGEISLGMKLPPPPRFSLIPRLTPAFCIIGLGSIARSRARPIIQKAGG